LMKERYLSKIELRDNYKLMVRSSESKLAADIHITTQTMTRQN